MDPEEAHEALLNLDMGSAVGDSQPTKASATFTPQGQPVGLVVTYADGWTRKVAITRAGCSVVSSFTQRFKFKVGGGE